MRNLSLHLASILLANGLLDEIDGHAVYELGGLCLDHNATVLHEALIEIGHARTNGYESDPDGEAYEEAYIAACESDSPNSPDFDSVLNNECAKRGIEL